MKLPNLDYFGSLQSGQPLPEGFGAKLKETFQALVRGTQNTEQQGNTNPNGQPESPPPINSLMVTAMNGHHTVAIVDQNPGIRRGINYWLERDTNPNFSNPHVIDLGQSRMHQEFLGNGTYYWRGHSSYSSSPSNGKNAAYWGSAARPLPVSAGGSIGAALPLPSQGSGTGAPAQGLVGPGPVPVRHASTGIPWQNQRFATPGGFQNPSGSPPVPFSVAGGSSVAPAASFRWVIEDTLANQTGYAPAAHPNAIYLATDTLIFYYSTGSAWTKVPINTATAGTYGDGTHVAAVTVDANGRVSGLSDVPITFPAITSAAIIAALGYTPAHAGGAAAFSLTADLTTGAVTGSITQV